MQQSTAQFDIAVVITDGNPTVYGNAEGPGNYTRFREVENGIFSANAVKAEDTRMLAVRRRRRHQRRRRANLAAISGPTSNSDYFQTTNYAAGRHHPAEPRPGQLHRLGHRGQAGGAEHGPGRARSPAPYPAGGWTFGATTDGQRRDHRTGQRARPPSGPARSTST